MIDIRESGYMKLSDVLRFKIENLIKEIPEEIKNCLYEADYASFTAITALILSFSPEKMKELGVTEEQIKSYVEQNSQELSPLGVMCKFEEKSSELSFNEYMGLRREAMAEEEFFGT